jgi:hypothetical protein
MPFQNAAAVPTSSSAVITTYAQTLIEQYSSTDLSPEAQSRKTMFSAARRAALADRRLTIKQRREIIQAWAIAAKKLWGRSEEHVAAGLPQT